MSQRPELLAAALIAFGGAFSVLWYLDHKTHLCIWKRDISDGELRTHRMILYASWVLLGSLVLMAWSKEIALPLFIGAWLTRTLHEGIDELHWHLPRCSERETLIHLGMWINVHAGTALLFFWGYFLDYRGFADLAWPFHAAFAALFAVTGWIGNHEIRDYLPGREGKS